MSSIVEFLRARLDEDEATAKAARGDDGRLGHGFEVREDWGRWALLRRYGSLDVVDEDGNQVTFDQEGLSDSVASPAIGEHIARHDPARVLREVQAKRRIVDACEECRSSVMAYRSPRWRDAMNEQDKHEWRKAEARYRVAEDACRALASVYADHPDFDPEWAWM